MDWIVRLSHFLNKMLSKRILFRCLGYFWKIVLLGLSIQEREKVIATQTDYTPWFLSKPKYIQIQNQRSEKTNQNRSKTLQNKFNTSTNSSIPGEENS